MLSDPAHRAASKCQLDLHALGLCSTTRCYWLQADKGAHGLQKNVVMAKVDELSAWHEELKACLLLDMLTCPSVDGKNLA